MKSVKGELDDLKGLKFDKKTKYPVFGKPQYDLFIDDKNMNTKDWE